MSWSEDPRRTKKPLNWLPACVLRYSFPNSAPPCSYCQACIRRSILEMGSPRFHWFKCGRVSRSPIFTAADRQKKQSAAHSNKERTLFTKLPLLRPLTSGIRGPPELRLFRHLNESLLRLRRNHPRSFGLSSFQIVKPVGMSTQNIDRSTRTDKASHRRGSKNVFGKKRLKKNVAIASGDTSDLHHQGLSQPTQGNGVLNPNMKNDGKEALPNIYDLNLQNSVSEHGRSNVLDTYQTQYGTNPQCQTEQERVDRFPYGNYNTQPVEYYGQYISPKDLLSHMSSDFSMAVTNPFQHQYHTATRSPYWPYDAPQMNLNHAFNFFTPSFPYHGSFQHPSQSPVAAPSVTGVLKIDDDSTITIPWAKSITHIPEPTQDYILTASVPPFRLEKPSVKLLILDLNGTLLYRPRHPERDRNHDMRESSMNPLLRPHLAEFNSYIFRHFKVMFWSSATRRNVESMITAVTTPQQRSQLVGIWARDTLGLTLEDYHQKVLTIKDLRKVFESKRIGKFSKTGWDVSNTILLDDSVFKASYQPYNHICVPEFVVPREDWDQTSFLDDSLWQVAGYLEELRYQGHVARFIKQHPFQLGDGWNGMCMGLAWKISYV